jgi:CRP-like cAMP-binding protein
MVLTRLAALGSKDPSGNGILIPLSHQELAQFAQITPETLSRILRGLKEKKIIRMVKRRLWVVDGESLKKSLEKNDDSGPRK